MPERQREHAHQRAISIRIFIGRASRGRWRAIVRPGARRHTRVGAAKSGWWHKFDLLWWRDLLRWVKLVGNPKRIADKQPKQAARDTVASRYRCHCFSPVPWQRVSLLWIQRVLEPTDQSSQSSVAQATCRNNEEHCGEGARKR